MVPFPYLMQQGIEENPNESLIFLWRIVGRL